MKKVLIVIYLGLMSISYPGCVGYWMDKYPSSNIWEERGFCTMMTLWPLGPVALPLMLGFYNRGFRF